MIGGQRWLQRREYVNLALAADLENGAAAVADVQITFTVEDDAGGHAHPFHVGGGVACAGNLIYQPVAAAGYVQRLFLIERQTGGVDDVGHQRLRVQSRVDLEHRNRSLDAGPSAEGDEDVARVIHHRV